MLEEKGRSAKQLDALFITLYSSICLGSGFPENVLDLSSAFFIPRVARAHTVKLKKDNHIVEGFEHLISLGKTVEPFVI